MQGLGIRLARGLNTLMKRRGRVVADRYHARLLATPLELRRALLYVLNNTRRHAAQRGADALAQLPRGWLDPFSSAPVFDGWVGHCFALHEGPLAWGLCWTRPLWAPSIETADIVAASASGGHEGQGGDEHPGRRAERGRSESEYGAGATALRTAGAVVLRHLARRPRTWLLGAGWRRRGLLSPDFVPLGEPRRSDRDRARAPGPSGPGPRHSR
jgi:hypothetical protein